MSGAGGRGWGVALCLLAASADGRLLSFHRIVYQLSQGMVTKWRPACLLLTAAACGLRLQPTYPLRCRQRGQRVIGETVASAISMDESRMWHPDFKASRRKRLPLGCMALCCCQEMDENRRM